MLDLLVHIPMTAPSILSSTDKGRRSSGGPVEEVKTPGKSLSSSSGSGRSASLTSNGELNKNSGKENKEFPTVSPI